MVDKKERTGRAKAARKRAAEVEPAAKKPPPPREAMNVDGGGKTSGFLTACFDPDVQCIAPPTLDGGTRFMLRAADGVEELGVPVFRRLVGDLRMVPTRDQERAWRAAGGRTCMLPLAQLELGRASIAAEVIVSGGRRERLAFHVPSVVYIHINPELGTAKVEFKAPILWAAGYRCAAERWLDLVLWWMTGEHCELATAFEKGWKTTGIDLCADFTGIDFHDRDVLAFLGFQTNELVKKFGRWDKLETIAIGRRSSPISMVIYDKEYELLKCKGGDDGTYRATHLANGWDGTSPRRRVEFRLTGRALEYQDENTGELLDLRNPAELAVPEVLQQVWALVTWAKRLADPETATRKSRQDVDTRWKHVQKAAGQTPNHDFRQTRQAQTDAWSEATRRARRDAQRAMRRVAALYEAGKATNAAVVQFMDIVMAEEDKAALVDYQRGYRRTREEFIGPEIATLGLTAWLMVMPTHWGT